MPIRFKFEFVGDLTKTFLEAATLDTVSKSVNRELRRCTRYCQLAATDLLSLWCSLRQSDTCAVQQKFMPFVQQLCEKHNQTADVILASVSCHALMA